MVNRPSRYDASTEDKQYVWKNMIINFIERYFYIICFATYAREHVRNSRLSLC